MARTPDRSPGAMIEDEEIRFVSNATGPTVAGAFNYNGTEFVMRDAVGTFNPRSSASAFTTSGTSVETSFTASFPAGLSGSLTRLADGTSYLIAGTNVTITSSSNGSITISSTHGIVGALDGGTGLSALPSNGQIAIGNGSGYTLSTLTAGQGIAVTSSSGSISISANGNAPQSIVLNDTATGTTPKVMGSVYFASARTLSASSTAFMGGSLVGDVSCLQLAPESSGSAIATWQKTGTLGSQTLTSGGTVSAAGWYDLVLQCTSGSGVAFCKGLYLI